MNESKPIEITETLSLEDLAGLVCEALAQAGIEAILTGGAVVTIYSNNEFQSYDLDFVTYSENKEVVKVMEALGFTREKSRHFIHPRSKFFVEFPGYAPTIGDEPIEEVAERRTRGGVLKLLTPTQSVMDRLAAFFHWNDEQGLKQAWSIAKRHPIDLKQVHRWAIKEGAAKKWAAFESGLAKNTKPKA